jgi:Flp pilus assembly protein TadG
MNSMRQQSGRSRFAVRRNGVATVEFALTASVLFMFLFAMLEFGRYNMILQTANNAAFDAARACIVPGASVSLGQAAGTTTLSAAGIRDYTVSISPNPITGTTSTVTATVTIPVTTNLWTRAVFCKSTTVTKTCTLTCDWVDSAY